jgi:5-methylcytosine-specific restriction endonuclease McrA
MRASPYYPFVDADHKLKSAVWWRSGTEIAGYDPGMWRRDIDGKAMKFSDHGDRDSKFGWEIDHIKPSSKGGSDDLSNLQPLHWQTNVAKGDTYPWYAG